VTELARRVRRFYAYTGASSFALWIPFWTLWIRGNLASDFEFTLVDVAFWLGMLASQLPVRVLADRICGFYITFLRTPELGHPRERTKDFIGSSDRPL